VNANELADKLLDSLTMEYDCDKYMEQAATMLRQQAKELVEAGHMIGVLREYISDLENGLDSSIKLNKAQAEKNKK
jgi:type II secretory pathway component PulF